MTTPNGNSAAEAAESPAELVLQLTFEQLRTDMQHPLSLPDTLNHIAAFNRSEKQKRTCKTCSQLCKP